MADFDISTNRREPTDDELIARIQEAEKIPEPDRVGQDDSGAKWDTRKLNGLDDPSLMKWSEAQHGIGKLYGSDDGEKYVSSVKWDDVKNNNVRASYSAEDLKKAQVQREAKLKMLGFGDDGKHDNLKPAHAEGDTATF